MHDLSTNFIKYKNEEERYMDLKQKAIIGIIAVVIIVAGIYASGIINNGNAKGNITVLAGAGTMSAMNDL